MTMTASTPGESCTLSWPGPDTTEELTFTVAEQGEGRHKPRPGGVVPAMLARLNPSLDTAGWWIEAHPGLILAFHFAVIATALAVVALFTGGLVKIGPRLFSEARVLGRDATQLRYRDLHDGTEHRVAAGEGEIVVVALWATWCHACVEEFEPLSRLHASGDAQIVHLSREDPETIEAFLAEHPSFDFGSTHGVVEEGDWFPAARIPTVLIVGADGRIAGLLQGSTTYEHLSWAIARARGTS
jgi:hypothetical protein